MPAERANLGIEALIDHGARMQQEVTALWAAVLGLSLAMLIVSVKLWRMQ